MFVPGSSSGGGQITFAEGGKPLKIRGSLVANVINFNARERDKNGYSVSIYSDSRILNSRLPVFSSLMDVIY